MGKMDLAVKMADELGVSVSKASRFIDEVGFAKASSVVDEAVQAGARSVPSFKMVAAGSGALGAGALLWRQQDVSQARALAQQSSNYGDALTKIVEADLPPDVKKALLEDLAKDGGATGDSGSSDDGDGGNGLLPTDPTTLIILMIVLIFVLKFALEGDD